MLFEIYGGLLTDRQRDVMDLYYNYDLSLAEIAEQLSISRQGVHDLIRRSELALTNAEDCIGYLKYRDRIFVDIHDVEKDISRLLLQLNDEFNHDSGKLRRKLTLLRDKVMRIGDL
jgi:predicted DNA-binding protein YlxM (UPF0122 family)